MYPIEPLHEDCLHCYFDEAHLTPVVVYVGEVSPQTTNRAYDWLKRLTTRDMLPVIRGTIFDFRKVTYFNAGNFSTVQRKSRELSEHTSSYQVPTALLVANMYQEQMVRVSSRIAPGENRKKVVRSAEDAYAFFDEFRMSQV